MVNKISNEMVYRLIWNNNISAYSENREYESEEVKELLRKIEETDNELQKLYADLKIIVKSKK